MNELLALAGGVALGALIVALLLRSSMRAAAGRAESLAAEVSELKQERARLEAEKQAEARAAAEKLALLEDARAKLQEAFKALSSDALARNNESFLNLARATLEKYQEGAKGELEKRHQAIQKSIEPIGSALSTFNQRVDKIEERRMQTDAGLKEQLRQMAEAQQKLHSTTSNLVNALRKPEGRGRWGEMQLRRTVELAGMINYCDFEEQASVDTGEGRLRPDMVIRLPNERRVVVDSKVPLAAYLEALEAADGDARDQRLTAHARHLKEHINQLGQKKYWSQFDDTPEFVVLFLPNEAIFSAALEQDPGLIELGVANRVILATPTTLIALLKAVAYGWQQEAIAREAREISALGKEMYDRVGKFLVDFGRVGRSLEQAVGHYNTAARSAEARLMVTGRKFENLKAVTTDGLPEVKPIEKLPAQLPEAEASEG